MKVILTDTNKLFGLFRAMVLYNSTFEDSILVEYMHNNTVYVSTFVLSELSKISLRKWLDITDETISIFVAALHVQVYESANILDLSYVSYVSDTDDAQLVQDAVEIWATHLLTNNTKDFVIDSIYNDFWIFVVSDIKEIS